VQRFIKSNKLKINMKLSINDLNKQVRDEIKSLDLNPRLKYDIDNINADLKIFTLDDLIHPVKQTPIKVGIVNIITSWKGSNTNLYERLIEFHVDSKKCDIILAPEYSFLPRGSLLSIDQVEQYKKRFKKLSENDILIVPGTFVWYEDSTQYNTAFGFYKGQELFKYTKKTEGGEIVIANSNDLEPAYGLLESEKQVFDYEGFKVGVEICVDAGDLKKKEDVSDLDLVLLISCGWGSLKESMQSIRHRGYGVMVEGLTGFNEVCYQTDYYKMVEEMQENMDLINLDCEHI
jgi:hypothetical protein